MATSSKDIRPVVRDLSGFSEVLAKTYTWMSLSVLITMVTSYVLVSQGVIFGAGITNWWIKLSLFFVPFFILLFIMGTANKSLVLGLGGLMAFSLFEGYMVTIIYTYASMTNILSALIATVVIFATMSIYGLVTKRDLTKIGTIAGLVVFAIIITSLINIFWLDSGTLNLVISAVSVVVFAILTAFDINKLQDFYVHDDLLTPNGLAVIGAVQLYLDFLNIFLSLVDLFSDNK